MRNAPGPDPWPDVAAAGRFLDRLAGSTLDGEPASDDPGLDAASLAAWLDDHDLSSIAFAGMRNDPALTDALRETALATAAGALSHGDNLERIEQGFAAAGLPLVLLKGAALGRLVYGSPALRAMSDLDIWVAEMEPARRVMAELGFAEQEQNPDRPLALQRIAGGEIQFKTPGREHGLVELHWSAFPGWWLKRTAVVDEAAVRARTPPLEPGRHARRRAGEDMLLQVACHLGINKFEGTPLRGLMDLALLARSTPLDWQVIEGRARRWRLATLTWTVLDLAHRLIGLPGSAPTLDRLRPSAPRRRLLRELVPPRRILDGTLRDGGRFRWLLLLLLADRSRDALRLIARTVWPEPAWLAARYAGPVGHLGHLLRLLSRGI